MGVAREAIEERSAVGVVALALVVAACGCTGESSTTDGSAPEPLSAAELGWIREYSAWTIDVYDEELGPRPGRELVEACRDRLAEVGPPPTDRLEPAWERSAGVCPLLSRAGSVRRAKDVVEDADDLVLPFFLDGRELALSAGLTRESRADLRLSGFASQDAEVAQEVRCWSDEDWRRVVREDNAWTAESDDPDELYGWQDSDTDRIHMRLEQCNLLRRLGPENVVAWDREDQVEAADAVATLVHEIQHLVLPDAEEGEVECAAAAALPRFARRLGATSDEAARLARLYVTDVREDLPDEYRADCEVRGRSST